MNKSKTIIPMMFISTLIISPTAFAKMPDSLFGYKIGDPCEKTTIINDKDVEVVLYCAGNINQIASITVKFRSIDYDTLLEETSKTIINPPTTQTKNQKEIGCPRLKWMKKTTKTTPDPKKFHFTGRTEWLSKDIVPNTKNPKVEVYLRAGGSLGCGTLDKFESTISLTHNAIWETDHQTSLQNENAKKNKTLNKLFN